MVRSQYVGGEPGPAHHYLDFLTRLGLGIQLSGVFQRDCLEVLSELHLLYHQLEGGLVSRPESGQIPVHQVALGGVVGGNPRGGYPGEDHYAQDKYGQNGGAAKAPQCASQPAGQWLRRKFQNAADSFLRQGCFSNPPLVEIYPCDPVQPYLTLGSIYA